MALSGGKIGQHTLKCHLACHMQQVAQQLLLPRLRLAELRQAIPVLGDDQEVHGRLHRQQDTALSRCARVMCAGEQANAQA